MDRLSSPIALLFASLSSHAVEVVPAPQWQRHFDAAGARGTFVLFDPALDQYRILDETRARRGFLPASTFKVANAVIGLETGAIADEREVFRWDGKPQVRREWERDHTLASGMKDSVVWMYQEVARRIGKARMKDWLARLDYGNRHVGGGIDHFWLQGELRITAMQQVAFLHKLAEGRLPATQRAQRLVREAMVVEKTREHTLFAKTGSTGGKGAVHWWVGWVERRGKPVAYFAMNLDVGPETKFEDRFRITRAILDEVAALPAF